MPCRGGFTPPSWVSLLPVAQRFLAVLFLFSASSALSATSALVFLLRPKSNAHTTAHDNLASLIYFS
jgi:hypothetical protein